MTAAQRTDVPASDVRQSIIGIVQAVLDREVIDPAVDLFDQGVPSLVFLRILARINEKYDIAVDVATLEEASIDELSALVQAQLGGDGQAQQGGC
ncbi:MAG TPA: acyl carrier protein [Pseudonocardiaceae bacterium]|nr:acyl carrier protein [Pseudonocardiaceae bacterium]